MVPPAAYSFPEPYDIIDTSMISGRLICELAVLAVLCVLTIFFFPGVQGPYSVVHGPATALLATRAAGRFWLGIVRDALRSLGSCLVFPIKVLSKVATPKAVFQTAAWPECDAIL